MIVINVFFMMHRIVDDIRMILEWKCGETCDCHYKWNWLGCKQFKNPKQKMIVIQKMMVIRSQWTNLLLQKIDVFKHFFNHVCK
jgi:hypothetical protein